MEEYQYYSNRPKNKINTKKSTHLFIYCSKFRAARNAWFYLVKLKKKNNSDLTLMMVIIRISTRLHDYFYHVHGTWYEIINYCLFLFLYYSIFTIDIVEWDRDVRIKI